VADFRIARGRLAATYAIEEVAHVVVARVEPRGRFGQFFLQQLRIARLDPAARDENLAVCSHELHAVLLAFRIDHASVPGIRRSALTAMNNAAGVRVLDRILAGGRESVRNHLDGWLARYLDRPGLADAPQCDVVVMSAQSVIVPPEYSHQ